jgi:predicted O-methyltransferase YrrM
MPEILIAPQLREYLDSLVPERPEEVMTMEKYARDHSFPIIGPAAGQLCYLLARLIGAKRVFEMGSGYGYSTYWFAKAVQENGGGEVHHVVWDDKLSMQARQHLARLGVGPLIKWHVSEAIETLKQTEGPFDIIFVDIDKSAYPDALMPIEAKLRTGGIMIVDNMLWSGRIFDRMDQDPNTKGVRALTRLMGTKTNWITSLVPIRDGLMVATKR